MRQYAERIGNLEFHTCDVNLLDIGKHITAEIILRYGDDEFVWSTAYWENDEFFNLHFVNSRPFDDGVNWEDFGRLAKIGQEYLEKSE